MEDINTIGRRKTSVARIYISKGKGKITVNKKDYQQYFPAMELQIKVGQPFEVTGTTGKFDVRANINGGGFKGQAEALQLAIARALCKINEEHRPLLRAQALLTRDPRMVERKKFGQPKARKKFQYSKR
ncbi:MAG: 30S ribosomal protein S9 [Flavobacteriales bacterium]|nr:MAG: 30S ribosomal protein S9 [Flavobacteriales bacterium]